MFDSIIGLLGNVVKIAAAPVEIAVDVIRAVTRPIADAVSEAVDDIKKGLE